MLSFLLALTLAGLLMSYWFLFVFACSSLRSLIQIWPNLLLYRAERNHENLEILDQ